MNKNIEENGFSPWAVIINKLICSDSSNKGLQIEAGTAFVSDNPDFTGKIESISQSISLDELI